MTEVERGGGRIGSYRLERLLGRGGFGVVYAGVDTRLGRRAAIKQLLPELSRDREIVERFFNEAKAAAGIDHPGIVEIYDVGWHADTAYFAMKLLDGDSLGKRLAAGPLDMVHACTIARQVGSALAAAHGRGIVHRDLKPDNIILVADDEVAIGERAIVLDFGIAKLSGDQAITNRTRTGMMMGTPTYMSPEQCRGSGDVDHRSDVYALGCILFEMLAGRPPFVSDGGGHVMGMHLFVEPPALAELVPAIPSELAAVVMRALAKQPDARIPNMAALLAALRPFGAGGATERTMARRTAITDRAHPRRTLVIASIAAACIIAGVAIMKLGLDRPDNVELSQSAPLSAQASSSASQPGTSEPSPQHAPSQSSSSQSASSQPAPTAASQSAAVPPSTPRPSGADQLAQRTTPGQSRPTSATTPSTVSKSLDAPDGTPPRAPSSASKPLDATQLLAQARDAQQRGDHATALARAELALTKQPGNATAHTIAATAACHLGNLEKTAAHITALSGSSQRAAKDACARMGITVDVHSSQPGPPPFRSNPPPRNLPPPPPPPVDFDSSDVDAP